MVKQYPYLNDISFLNQIYGQHNKTQYVKITVLDWHERVIQEVQGRVTSASMSVNGDSSVRRTANLSIKILNNDELYANSDSLFTINKKIFIELGIKNNFAHLNQYKDYPTIWFPFGVMIIQNYSISKDTNGINLSLSLGDKMCLLNGDAGGVIPASVNFESVDTLGPDGDLHTEWERINQIIPEMLNHFGEEDLNRIIVNDVDNKIKQVLKWKGANPLYMFIDKTDFRNIIYSTIKAPTNLNLNNWTIKTILTNYDAGYTYTDFVYPGELVAGAGDSICTVLDKIKNTLGNYEYYYDVFGNFIFQEKKNNLNTTKWRETYNKITTQHNEYLPYRYNTGLNHSVYDFKDSEFIISYNNSPQFNMIKNDFVVWGTRKDSNGMELGCRYHLAIDKRPFLEEDKKIDVAICFDTSMYDKIRRAYVLDRSFATLDQLKQNYPEGIVGKYYYLSSEDAVYTWVKDINEYQTAYLNYQSSGISTQATTTTVASENTDVVPGYVRLPLATCYGVKQNDSFVLDKDTDWRNILYFEGLINAAKGTDTGYYWAELCNEWPKIYDMEYSAPGATTKIGKWREDVVSMPTALDWWLDIIDDDATIGQFSVDNIGRRSYAKTDSGCNCVFEPDIPDVIMVDIDNDPSQQVDTRSQETKEQLQELGLIPINVEQPIYNALTAGGTFNSCYQHVRQLLTEYTDYNENISVTCLPIYHLEPNTRISLNDPESGIQGDYLINSISFDLSERGTMTISAKKCIEKI